MYTKEELEAYILMMQARKKDSSSRWMKNECQRGIDMAKAELAKLGNPAN